MALSRRASSFDLAAATRPRPAETTAEPTPDRVAIEHALAALPAQQRIAVVLHYLLDQSVADIATTLKISPGTVKSRLSRALRRLRAALGPELPADALVGEPTDAPEAEEADRD